MAEDNRESFMDWAVVMCDRLLASYARNGKSGAIENSNIARKNGLPEPQIKSNSGLPISGLPIKVQQSRS
jgi:hypothetical protein